MKMPTHLVLMNPTLEALRALGGSATIEELAQKVIEVAALPSEVTAVQHGRGGQTEVEYRLAWARNYLKNYGLLENPQRKVWVLTPAGQRAQSVDPKEVAKTVRAKFRAAQGAGDVDGDEDEEQVNGWREELLEVLHNMAPDAFERLCQRLLRQSGFIEVEVTGRTGDGGIDGHGIIQLAGMISFTVIFQAKRHKANISPSVVRDFRGAMVGRADKGLIITTAAFTREARSEATRDGAPPIDLITGEDLIEKLKALRLGVRVTTRTVEDVEVDGEWFSTI